MKYIKVISILCRKFSQLLQQNSPLLSGNIIFMSGHPPGKF